MDDATALDRMRTLEARILGLPASADLAAVHAGVERLRAQLAQTRTREHDEVFTTSIPDPCARAPPDGRNDTGCEVDTRSDNANCGACGNACPAGSTCVSSVCSGG